MQPQRLSDEDLAAIEQRLKNATPGPWEDRQMSCQGDKKTYCREVVPLSGRWEYPIATLLTRGDGAFIANAPTDVVVLLAEVNQLRAENALLRLAIPAEQELKTVTTT